jgi:ribosomal protein S5
MRRLGLLRCAALGAAPHLGHRLTGGYGGSIRSLAYIAPQDTREGRRRKEAFWRKWGQLSDQEFWQDVGFDNDGKKESLRTGKVSKAKREAKRLATEKPEFQEPRLEDEDYFLGQNALAEVDHYEDEYYYEGEETEAGHSAAVPDAGGRGAEERMQRARQALLYDDGMPSGRRAELLALLEDLGPEGLLPALAMPAEKIREVAKEVDLLGMDPSRNLLIARSFVDSLKLRDESGDRSLPEGAYFAYLLNTRRVSKSTSEGKRMSYSTLVVVGNGKGVGGIGMGKDAQPGRALHKATVDARKNLIAIERFDNRTLFHAIDDRFAKTKLVLRLRRPGSGTRCSWVVWKILSAFGITDVSVKLHGSRNPTTVAHAMVNALQRATSAQQVAERRGLRVLDMDPGQVRVPGY